MDIKLFIDKINMPPENFKIYLREEVGDDYVMKMGDFVYYRGHWERIYGFDSWTIKQAENSYQDIKIIKVAIPPKKQIKLIKKTPRFEYPKPYPFGY